MHHALLIPDVQAYILASVKEDKLNSRLTIAMLARTCKVLSEASLDALWSELHSLHPLASCIYMANTMSLSDELTAEASHNTEPDLSIFHKYAHRVRKLDVSGQHSMRSLRRSGRIPNFTDDLSALLYFPVPSPLLPNLRHLHWSPATSLNLIRHLLTPHLLSLKIQNTQWAPESSPFVLTKIPQLCPKIKSLTLQIHWADPTLPGQGREPAQCCLSQVTCSWGMLEELDCNLITIEGALRLSVLSSLRILRLQLTNLSIINLPPNSLSFPLLHTLQFQTDSADTAIAMIKAMKDLPKSLRIEARSMPTRRGGCTREILVDLLCLIGDASHYKLQDFSLSIPPLLGDNPVNLSDMLQPLFPCCELRTLSIRMTSQFTLGDDDLLTMVAAWSQLEELELIDHRRSRVIPPHPHHQPQPPMAIVGPGQPAQFPQPLFPLGVPATGLVMTPPLPQPPMATMGPGQAAQLPQPLFPPPTAGPVMTPPPPHLQPQPSMTTMGPGQAAQLPQPLFPPPTAGLVTTPTPPHLPPQPSMTTMGPGQAAQLPQPLFPPPAAGPVIPLPPPHELITTMGLGQPTQLPQPLPAAVPVQTPQFQTPQPLAPTIHVHMNPHPLLELHPGPQNPFQHLPVIPQMPAPHAVMITHPTLPSRSRTAEITFHGLISLLQLCPNLYYFDLAIDATRLDGLQGHNPGGGVRNRLVKTARLMDSPVGDPQVVARILLDILPELNDVTGLNSPLPFNPPHHMMHQGWFAVRQFMLIARQHATSSEV